MTGLEITFGIILIVFALFLVVAVLLQSSKDQGMGVIAGAAESFLGKDRNSRLDKLLNKLLGMNFNGIVMVEFTSGDKEKSFIKDIEKLRQF